MRVSTFIKNNFLLEDKKFKYELQNVNGGYSDGVEIKPGNTADIMDIVINIYGGSQNNFISYEVPQTIRELQDAFIAARQTGDQVSSEISSELKEYYKNLKTAISLEMIKLMKQFDQQALDVVSTAVGKINQKYQ